MRRKLFVSILVGLLLGILFCGTALAAEQVLQPENVKITRAWLNKIYYLEGETLDINMKVEVTTTKPVKLKLDATFGKSTPNKQEYIWEITQEEISSGDNKVTIDYDFKDVMKLKKIDKNELIFMDVHVYEVVDGRDIYLAGSRVNPSIYLLENGDANTPEFSVYKSSDAARKNNVVSETWLNEDVIVVLSPEDPYKGVEKYKYQLSGDQKQDEQEVNPLENKTYYEITINTEGVTEVIAKIIDQTKKISEPEGIFVRIDKTKPVIKLESDGDNDYIGGIEGPTITVTDTRTDEKECSGVDTASLKYFWSTASIEEGELSEETFNSNNAKTFIHSSQITDIPKGVSGTYYLYVMAKDVAGNATFVKSKEYLVDEVAPEVTFDKKSNEEYQKSSDVSVTVTVSDNGGSDLKEESLKYLWEKGPKSVEKTAKDFESAKTFTSANQISLDIEEENKEGTYYLWIYAEDKAGNVTITSTEGFKVDDVAPTVSINPEENTSYEKSVEIIVTFTDNGVGVDDSSLKYFWSANAEDSKKDNDESYTATIENNKVTTNSEDGEIYLYVIGKDELGNKVTGKSGPYKIDATAPEIKIEPQSNADQLSLKAPTVTVTDTSTKATHYVWKKVGEQAPTKPDEYTTPLGETVTPPTEDGDYILYVYSIDEAGNESRAQSGKFTINTKVPDVPEITARNENDTSSEIPNGGTTNGKVILEFTISEKDKEKVSKVSVTITKDGGAQGPQDARLGDSGKYTIEIAEAGKYSIKAKAVAAQSESAETEEYIITIDNTAPAAPIQVKMEEYDAENTETINQDLENNSTVENHQVKVEKPTGLAEEVSVEFEVFERTDITLANIMMLSLQKPEGLKQPGTDRTSDFVREDGNVLIDEAGEYDIYIYSVKGDKSSVIVKEVTIIDTISPKFTKYTDSFTLNENTSHKGDLAENTATDNLKVKEYKYTEPTKGTITDFDPLTGKFTYQASSYGADTFNIIAVDDSGNESDPLVITVTVRKVLTEDDCVTASQKNITTNKNTSKEVTLNSKDKNGDKITYTVLTEASSGTVVVTGNTVKYTPNDDYKGSDTFSLKASNEAKEEVEIKFNVTVKEPSTGGSTGGSGSSSGSHGGGGGTPSTSYNITVKVGRNRSVSPDGTVRVSENRSRTFTFTPDQGYEVAEVLVDGESVGAVKEYTFENVKENHTLQVTFKLISEQGPAIPNKVYDDVEEDDWYYDAVKFVTDNELMNGVGDNKFAPQSPITRGMVVTVLYRLSGENYSETSTFVDVAPTSYYSVAIAWAAENHIVNGVGDNLFAPDREIKREELAAIFARYIENMSIELEANNDDEDFADETRISSFAKEAVHEMRKLGLIQGKGENIFDPAGTASRAEVATVLMRFVEMAEA